MQAIRLCLVAAAVLLTSLAGGTDLQKTSASDSGLRGPVRQCIEQTTYVADGTVGERSFTNTSVYSPSGWLLERRMGQSPGPDYVTTYIYDAAGRLLKTSSGADQSSDTVELEAGYTYDDKGQLLSVSSSPGSSSVTTYDHDADGRERRVEHFPVFALAPNTAMGSITWENSDLQFAPPSGGTVTTIYDERDRPVEGQVSDANGRLMMRLIRTYDEQGRIQGDKLVPEDMESHVPEELGGQLNDAQRNAVAKFLGNAFATGESAYKYDSQGCMVERHRTGGVYGDELTTTAYNGHGDVSDEVTIGMPMQDWGTEFGIDEDGNMIPVSQSKAPGPSRAETRYAYEYDAQGNWTKKTTSVRQEQGEFKISTVINRTLSYY
jgi:hypothetical protein